jgi:RimJ/RimL family protein N-acetyltransferase
MVSGGDNQNPDYSIRRLLPADWPLLKAVRLKGLQADPASFSSTYDMECDKTDATWQSQLEDPQCGIFGLFHGDRIIGMTGVAVMRSDPSGESAILWGSWIDKNHRGKGLSSLLYEVRMEWAEAHPTVKKIVVGHYGHNEISRRANQRHGFVYTHTETSEKEDATANPMLMYELPVKTPKSSPPAATV